MRALLAIALAIAVNAGATQFTIEAPAFTMSNVATSIRVTATPTNFSGTLWFSGSNTTVAPTTVSISNGTVVASITLQGSGPVTISVATNNAGSPQCSCAMTICSWSPLGFLLSCQRQTGMICHYYDRIYYEPYAANFGAYCLLQAHPEQAPFVRNYMTWYLAHLNRPDLWGLSGSMYNYAITNFNETVALQNGQPGYDSSDATAGLFLATAWEYFLATNDIAFLRQNLAGLRVVAGAALGTQDSDGLTWAKPNYKVKYLEDQCETWTGLRLFAQLLQALGQPDWMNYQAAAQAMSAGIQTLWDTNRNCYFWAKYQNGTLQTNNWSNLIPDAQEQLWTILFNINPPGTARANLIWGQFTQSLPNWVSLNFQPLSGGPSPGAAFALVAARMQGGISPAYVQGLVTWFESSNYQWPFEPDAAGQLLIISVRSPPP